MTHQQVDNIIIGVFLAFVLFAIYRIVKWMFLFRRKHGTSALLLAIGVIAAILFGGWRLFWMIEPHIPYLLGGAFVLWVIYANLFIKSKKVERKKTFMEKIDDWVEEQNKYDEKILRDLEDSYQIEDINRQNGHYY